MYKSACLFQQLHIFQPDAKIEESQHFRLHVGTFQPLQAYSPSKTKFLSASVSRWMETLFIGLAFLKTWSMVQCVLHYNSGA